MKRIILLLFSTLLLLLVSCSSQKKLAYLSNLTETGTESFFTMGIPEYKIQIRDILYVTLKAMSPTGEIIEMLSSNRSYPSSNLIQNESGQYLEGYNVNSQGNISLAVIGDVHVEGLTIEEIKSLLQGRFSSEFKNAEIDCKLISFKFTVLGEVKAPGSYINYNNYLTVLEAIGRAGGIDDFGRRDKILIVRPTEKGTKTFTLNLQDKKILSSEAYFLLPNDVIIVQPQGHKIFNINLPTYTFILTTLTSTITMTLLLINYLGK
jgi:polysaccharide export outer membrane protein